MAYGLWQKYFYKLKRDTLKYIPAFAVLLLSGGALTPAETNKFLIFLLETDQCHISFMALGLTLQQCIYLILNEEYTVPHRFFQKFLERYRIRHNAFKRYSL